MSENVQKGLAEPVPEQPTPKPEGPAALRWIIIGTLAGVVAAAVAVVELIVRSLS